MSFINIVIPFNKDSHSLAELDKTLQSIPKSNLFKYIVITTSKLREDINYIKSDFKNIYSAYNIITKILSDGYVLYLVPGDIINGNNLLSLINEKYNIIQFNHNRKKKTGEIYHLSKFDIGNTIFDGISNLPPNMNCVYDKLYKVSFLKENNIKFLNHVNSGLIFNYTCLDKSTFAYKDIISLTHLIGTDVGNLDNSPITENNLIKTLYKSDKIQIAKALEEVYNKNQEDIYYGSIDFVFPYVTSDDPNWQKIYKESLTGRETDWSAGIERFRDNGLLKYLFRSLEKNMPWINKVHMIVMSDSQVPKWLDRSKVDIIYHKEFIPNNLLPSFNSSAIETFLPLLPRVSNTFIYSNDDLVAFDKLTPEYFFNKGKPKYSINIGNIRPAAPGDPVRKNAYNLIMNTNKERIIITQHGPLVYKKAWIKECYDKYKDILVKSCSTFREDYNYNQYVYAFYQMMEKSIVNTELRIKSFIARPDRIASILEEDFKNYDFVCINDSNMTAQQEWNKIIEKIDKIFPDKSKYEL